MEEQIIVKTASGPSETKEPKCDLWDSVLTILDDVALRLELDPGIHAILRQAEPVQRSMPS